MASSAPAVEKVTVIEDVAKKGGVLNKDGKGKVTKKDSKMEKAKDVKSGKEKVVKRKNSGFFGVWGRKDRTSSVPVH